MRAVFIPVNTPFHTQRVELDGADYVLSFEWNMRSGWFLGLADQDNNVIFYPKKLSPGLDILTSVTDDRRPRGMLICVDSTGEGAKPGFEDLGTRHSVVYFEEQEVEDLREELGL